MRNKKENDRRYYAKNRMQILARNKRYSRLNKNKIYLQKKNYQSINKYSISERKKKYFENNKGKISQRQRLYRILNEEKIRKRNRRYYLNNRDKIKTNRKEYEKYKRRIDVNYKISGNLRSRLYKAIKNFCKSGSAVKDLGCSLSEFKSHITSKFQSGMTWVNYGKWHLDHIIPLSSFNLSDRVQLLKACHYTNYQPLWPADNLMKSNKV
jgi:hypothetical protein